MLPVFIDTCVLLKPYLCDTLLTISESGVYRPLWSRDVLAELERNLRKRGASASRSCIKTSSCSTSLILHLSW